MESLWVPLDQRSAGIGPRVAAPEEISDDLFDSFLFTKRPPWTAGSCVLTDDDHTELVVES